MILNFGDWWKLNHPDKKYSTELQKEYTKYLKEEIREVKEELKCQM